MINVKLYKGSIFDVDTDVIVNPANSFLSHGGGLARLIDDIAGGYDDHGYDKHPWTLQVEQQRLIEYNAFNEQQHYVTTGDCKLGPPGLLSYKAICHAVGPIWKDGNFYESQLLTLAYYNSILTAHKAGYNSIVFPAISSGIFGAPIDEVAYSAWEALGRIKFDNYSINMDITFALTDDDHYESFKYQLIEWLDKA